MPELPEVETVCRGLRPAMVGARIAFAETRRADLRYAFPPEFAARITGRRVGAIDRRGKYILIRLSGDDNPDAKKAGGETLMIHLGMSGRVTVMAAEDAARQRTATSGMAGHNSGWAMGEAHDHVVFEMSNGTRIVYNDPRRFGFMDLFPSVEEPRNRHLAGMGPEPLGEDFSPAHLVAALKGKRTAIKLALLDQKIVAGLGNIYVCEALWRSGISPKRMGHTIGPARAARLVPAIKEVLADAIAAGGSSLRDYVQASGELGYFQHAWDAYDREGDACRRPGCGGTVRRIVQSGRSTFYCTAHQR